MAKLKNNILNNNIAGDTSNILIPDSSAINNGIAFKSNINSNVLNGFYNILSEAIQYLQFTVGLYNKEADYNEGNIASLVIKDSENYSIWQFRRNSNNPQVLNNNPPITGASITTVNGIDIYEGGTLNTDWDKLTQNYDVEATPNTVMIRDEEGASKINMPSNIKNTTAVNNEYLEEQLQSRLSTKQDKLIAGTNVEITEDNVINVQGDVATDAKSVSYDNSNTNLEYISGYSFPKFNVEIPTYNLVLTDGTTDFNASILKQEDGSYLLNGILENFNITNANEINIQIKSINNITDSYYIYALSSILSQFFNIENISSESLSLFEALENEINIQNKNNNFEFGFYTDSIDNSNFYLKIKSSETLETTSSTITLNIKNRVLRNTDVNIFYINNDLTIGQIQLNQINSSVAYQGTYNGYTNTTNVLNFYSDLDMSNYFNLSPDDETFTNTTGITSSNDKAVKFLIKLIENNIYSLVIAYQDGSQINYDDVFTLNLTPDKNYSLDPIYKNVTNVQELGESLALRYMLSPYYIQYPDAEGNFNPNEEPSVWFKKMYNVTTTWQIMFNTESVYFRTEGNLANADRVNGIQEDSIRPLKGVINVVTNAINNVVADYMINSGSFLYRALINQNSNYNGIFEIRNPPPAPSLGYDISRVMPTSQEIRTKNRLIRIYKLLTINGKKVSDVIGV
ncbi:hypothetical protein [uncultured Brachyspira sp.]|uniref:hypothetical protein n=1 Tax=uncultured Brachyspira sp. TaxID=221953 RepID=UPI0025EBEB4F|nr:hypothetical protein [uncultured Brachyspira sp.]